MRAINHAHSTRTDPFDNSVMSQVLADHRKRLLETTIRNDAEGRMVSRNGARGIADWNERALIPSILAWASTLFFLPRAGKHARRFDIELADDGHALTLAWGQSCSDREKAVLLR